MQNWEVGHQGRFREEEHEHTFPLAREQRSLNRASPQNGFERIRHTVQGGGQRDYERPRERRLVPMVGVLFLGLWMLETRVGS